MPHSLTYRPVFARINVHMRRKPDFDQGPVGISMGIVVEEHGTLLNVFERTKVRYEDRRLKAYLAEIELTGDCKKLGKWLRRARALELFPPLTIGRRQMQVDRAVRPINCEVGERNFSTLLSAWMRKQEQLEKERVHSSS